ncbi:hypothetical protein CONPUDRAFT_159225 [Coniophora puteana RWD-64-598 SS2]|uniref:Methyltransferase domain-containing protein n=1 Tax=Coniophora puteana (strain RWD-64-598) TaxID=741705 RepID=A0A5M3M8G6_CONPW|nr:uncharacterized protein CONPUDRAFT_159225 [Coniophora puteana RWD-64-598 SS2]EIW75090.1 hypothetical protein CONPUDRAFT_159225 [Coniophora puteana RWD-64-598 SS2]
MATQVLNASLVAPPAYATNTSEKRVFHGVTGAAYVLPADIEEGERLDSQHEIVKHIFGNRILYAPIAISGDDEVLDNGTGTGAWIFDMAQALPPSVSFYGVDLHTRLVPAQPPSNIHFSATSFLDLPPSWSSKFALVNQRLMVAALKQDEWTTCAREIMRVLRAGGWVQLVEICAHVFTTTGAREEDGTRISDMMGHLFRRKGLVQDCYKDLSGLLRREGFVNVSVEERSVPLGEWSGEDGARSLYNLVGVYRALKNPILAAGGFGMVNSPEEYDEYVDRFVKRCNEREGIVTKWYAICGQKPE